MGLVAGGRIRGRGLSVPGGGVQPGIPAGRSHGCECPLDIRAMLTPQGCICRVARLGHRGGYGAAPGRLASAPLWTETRHAGIDQCFPSQGSAERR